MSFHQQEQQQHYLAQLLTSIQQQQHSTSLLPRFFKSIFALTAVARVEFLPPFIFCTVGLSQKTMQLG